MEERQGWDWLSTILLSKCFTLLRIPFNLIMMDEVVSFETLYLYVLQ